MNFHIHIPSFLFSLSLPMSSTLSNFEYMIPNNLKHTSIWHTLWLRKYSICLQSLNIMQSILHSSAYWSNRKRLISYSTQLYEICLKNCYKILNFYLGTHICTVLHYINIDILSILQEISFSCLNYWLANIANLSSRMMLLVNTDLTVSFSKFSISKTLKLTD